MDLPPRRTEQEEMMNFRKASIPAAILAVLVMAAACTPAKGVTIGDYTWVDSNRNGIQDRGEGPLANVPIELYTTDGVSPEASTSSDKDGKYAFEGLAEGEYKLKFVPPPAFSFTVKDQLDDDLVDSDVNPAGNSAGWTDEFTVGTVDDLSLDAGFVPGSPATPTPTPAIVIPQPTAYTITPTPASLSGDYGLHLEVKQDKAGHFQYVKLPNDTSVTIEQTEGAISINFYSPDGSTTNITLSGPIDAMGNADLVGSGTVAGRTNISGTFTGMITVDSDGGVHVNGELTLGANAELPQGEPIIYTVSS